MSGTRRRTPGTAAGGTAASGTGRRTPVTVVCVFNDPEVRARCLDRSLTTLLPTAPGTEYLPLDNTTGRFASAGEALNAGARLAHNPVVAFAHQDVVLHSLVALEEAAAALVADPTLGALGPVGIDRRGEVIGRLRDRVVLLGREIDRPTPVDSLDEVLFLATRERLLDEPLSQDPDLAWHAYAVEYALRARRDGLRVAAAPIPVTHNSLTINLARLDEAHAAIAALHPDALPVTTTCGTVRSDVERGRPMAHPAHLARLARSPRLRDPLSAAVAAWSARTSRVARVDLRRDLDDVLDRAGVGEVDVVNVVRPGDLFAGGDEAELLLLRRARPVRVRTLAPDAVGRLLAERAAEASLVVTGLTSGDLGRLRGHVRGRPHVVCVHPRLGACLVLGPSAAYVA